MSFFGAGLLVASATNMPEGGRLVPSVDMGRTLFRAASPLVELDADMLLFHVAVEDAVDVFSALLLVLGRLVVAAAAAVRGFWVPWLANSV